MARQGHYSHRKVCRSVEWSLTWILIAVILLIHVSAGIYRLGLYRGRNCGSVTGIGIGCGFDDPLEEKHHQYEKAYKAEVPRSHVVSSDPVRRARIHLLRERRSFACADCPVPCERGCGCGRGRGSERRGRCLDGVECSPDLSH
jgi:hypothetical protein